MKQNELDELKTKYQEIELSSRKLDSCPDNHFLAIRLDGFRATKSYLRDVLVNETFNQSFIYSTQIFYRSFTEYLKGNTKNAFVCAYLANDEFSSFCSIFWIK